LKVIKKNGRNGMKDGFSNDRGTRERLLQAAGEMFSRHGFRGTTVRNISRRANANVAAVNYHFGDKEALYSAVLKHTLNWADEKFPRSFDLSAGATAALRNFIRSFLLQILDEGRPAWHGKLMALEIVAPTAALDQVIEDVLGPLHKSLAGIVRELLGEADSETVRLCTLSIIGQCVYYHNARKVITRLYDRTYSLEEIERLSDHIAQFSLSAMRGLAQSECTTMRVSAPPRSVEGEGESPEVAR
jgi:TetR/AcrR family transcriptional regulator, regulator of cefoperazone and chloramphenicol sensitivity